MSLSTPVALIVFNRPDLTRIVFEAIKAVRPERLLVIADGPRNSEEAVRCAEARRIIEDVDWSCEVLTNFADINLGCKERVSSGIDWVFSEAEEAIIVEDDCLADPSFFTFAEQLLRRYRDDPRVMHVGGSNFISDKIKFRHSYDFSRYTFAWGWASWRRAWQLYDKQMKSWPEKRAAGWLEDLFETAPEQEYWARILDATHAGEIDTWDFQWFYTCWVNHGLAIIPHVNLVSNLGFRADATHTKTAHEREWLANIPRASMGAIDHPETVTRNLVADNYISKVYFGCDQRLQNGSTPTGMRYYWSALKYKLSRLKANA